MLLPFINIIRYGWAFVLLCPLLVDAQDTSPARLRALYNSLDPRSIAQHLALYELYPDTPEGRQALNDAYELLANAKTPSSGHIALPSSLISSIHGIVGLVNKHPDTTIVELDDQELGVINAFASRLANRRLDGFQATSEEAVLKLPADQIDLSRAILLTQLGNDAEALKKINSYEASIDLMALQILTRVKLQDPPQMKISAINHFIFEETGFRFPPHSSHAKDIDLYTFLPSVLDSRRGVCLGVSILYIALAQRLNLDLEMITPPGHIFVSWRQGEKVVNIETTARGIHLPDEDYLGVDTRSLQKRTVKEVIGLAHFNQASVYWERKQYDKALASYSKARPYLPQDRLLTEFMGLNCLLQGDIEHGKEMLQGIVGYIPDYTVTKGTIIEDYLNGTVDVDGLEAIFMQVDETRESLLAKKRALETALEKYPKFREGIFSLAGVWLQLHRTGEALQTLCRYHTLDPNHATVEYYLSALYAERLDLNKAWQHFRIAEKLVKQRDHEPEAILKLRQALSRQCPE